MPKGIYQRKGGTLSVKRPGNGADPEALKALRDLHTEVGKITGAILQTGNLRPLADAYIQATDVLAKHA